MPDSFLAWGRSVIDATATLLEHEIPGARRGTESRLPGYEALYVHFRDEQIPQSLAVWLFATRSGAANNVSGYDDAIGVGLKHDADEELDPGAWRFRGLPPFTWRRQIDDRYEGFRWLRNARDLPPDPQAAGLVICERVLKTLHRSRAVSARGGVQGRS